MFQTANDSLTTRSRSLGACTAASVQLSPSSCTGLSAVTLAPTSSGWSEASTNGTLVRGQSCRIELAFAVNAQGCDAALDTVASIGSGLRFWENWNAIPSAYERRWQQAFVPENTEFSGNLPMLETDDTELSRTFYGSLMSMMLVNKMGLDSKMEVEKATPSPMVVSRFAGCVGTYMNVGGSTPFQLRPGKQQLHISQFAGAYKSGWMEATAAVDGDGKTLAVKFDNGLSAHGHIVGDGCERIVFATNNANLGSKQPALQLAQPCLGGTLSTPTGGFHEKGVWAQFIPFSHVASAEPTGVELEIQGNIHNGKRSGPGACCGNRFKLSAANITKYGFSFRVERLDHGSKPGWGQELLLSWKAGPATCSFPSSPAQSSDNQWVKIREAGPWNLFVAAGALLGNTAFYLWDTSGASLLWTLIDPKGMATANSVFGSADPLVKNACDYISMRETGKYYAFSAISSFQAMANEVRIGGASAAARRIPLTGRTLVEQLVATANEYLRLPTVGEGSSLPDWGAGASAFLECQDSCTSFLVKVKCVNTCLQ